jgi:hypothetical protein
MRIGAMCNISSPLANFQMSLSLADLARLGTVLRNQGNLEVCITVSAPTEIPSTDTSATESMASKTVAVMAPGMTPGSSETLESPFVEPMAPISAAVDTVQASSVVDPKEPPAKPVSGSKSFTVWLPEHNVLPISPASEPATRSDSDPIDTPINENSASSPVDEHPRTAALRERVGMTSKESTTSSLSEEPTASPMSDLESAALAAIRGTGSQWLGPRWRELHGIAEEVVDALVARGALVRHPQLPGNLGLPASS